MKYFEVFKAGNYPQGKFTKEQIEEINTRVAEYVNNKENRLQTMHLQYENLEKEFKNGTFDKEKTQVVPKIKIDILNSIGVVIEKNLIIIYMMLKDYL